MTVLLTLYIFLPLTLGGALVFDGYFIQLALNIIFVVTLYLLSKKVPAFILIIPMLVLAIYFQLMLGIAICALFIRPHIPFLTQTITIAFITATFMLGTLITFNSKEIISGIMLGVIVFGTQIIAAYIVARKMHWRDRIFLAFAQYNGITSIILALIVGAIHPEVITIVAIAVLSINLIYYSTNFILEKKLS